MLCRVTDLRYKEVVNVQDGSCLGYVSDVELDTVTAKVTAIVLPGQCKLMGMFMREEDVVIPWSDIEVIGEDTILVNMRPEVCEVRSSRNRFFNDLFG